MNAEQFHSTSDVASHSAARVCELEAQIAMLKAQIERARKIFVLSREVLSKWDRGEPMFDSIGALRDGLNAGGEAPA